MHRSGRKSIMSTTFQGSTRLVSTCSNVSFYEQTDHDQGMLKIPWNLMQFWGNMTHSSGLYLCLGAKLNFRYKLILLFPFPTRVQEQLALWPYSIHPESWKWHSKTTRDKTRILFIPQKRNKWRLSLLRSVTQKLLSWIMLFAMPNCQSRRYHTGKPFTGPALLCLHLFLEVLRFFQHEKVVWLKIPSLSMTLVHKRSIGLNCLFPSGDTPEDLGLIAVQW